MKLIYNASIYTLDGPNPTASAIAIDGGRVIAVGDSQSLRPTFASRASELETLDAGGRAIIPGLIDAHIHLEHYALGLQNVDCETPTRLECLRRVSERVRQLQPGVWVLGHGWNQNNWQGGFGSASDLDAVAPQNPVYLTAKSLHAAWANSAALKAAGLNADMPDPTGGRIGRDESGQPNGVLFESAMELVQSAMPEPTLEQVVGAIEVALPVLAKMGLTALHDFDQRRCFSALQVLHLQDRLSLRVVKSIPLGDLPYAAALGLRTGFGDEFLRIGSVKAFADGALGPRTAAMLQPYEGEPENRGILMLDAEQLYEHGRLAVDAGISLAVHAIGDRAVHEVLNALAQIRRYELEIQGTRTSEHLPLRHRIEHVQVIHPDDVSRLGELGIVASMQPVHAPSDMRMADQFWGERSRLAYAWRTQIDHGAVLAFGSDAPVESPNPFWGLHAAMTRRRLDGSPGPEGWYPEQRLSLREALRGFTFGPAYTAHIDDRLGKLAPGYLADLLVLDRDPFLCEPDAIKEIRPLMTMVGGEWVFREF
jgi:predicted amidohydrolase YtcJ